MAYIDTHTAKFYFCELFLAVPFHLSWKILRTPRRNGCSYEKGSLGKDIPSIGTLVGLSLALTWKAASALLGLTSFLLINRHGLCRWPDWAPYRLSARAHAPGDQSWCFQGRVPNSAASSTLGSLKRFSCRLLSREGVALRYWVCPLY
jgi:hypothetical protein